MTTRNVVSALAISLILAGTAFAAEEVKAPAADAKKCEELSKAVAAAKGDAAKTTSAEKALTDAGCKPAEKKQ